MVKDSPCMFAIVHLKADICQKRIHLQCYPTALFRDALNLFIKQETEMLSLLRTKSYLV